MEVLMRLRRRFLALLAAPMAVGLASVDTVPAAAGGSGVCNLITRKEAGDLLGYNVVKTTEKTSSSDDSAECTYRTKKVQKEFKEEYDRNLKIQLELTVGPVTDELRADLQDVPFDDGERVEGLGDEAYATKFDQVIAISGTTAVSAKLQNYTGSPTKFRSVAEGAVRAALPRLGNVNITPLTY
jgi:hypothetical protein